ncbi:putative N-acetyltransferase YjcF [Metalysinibacillus saudimassiliensis]|uniref:Putative N-acetyltransferase YjcF n=1 Tax=Metalysinibacillus saudimassiliensis TaxID=1461583 RepID=A0A078M7J5_9BACL|nr:putative N-acetyltransferase YjcF [Metalysinibacillus saudimassiliensis]
MYNVIIARTEQQKKDAFAVRKKVFVEEQSIPLHLEIDDFDTSDDVVHFVLYENDTVVGAARIRESEPGVAKIERVCIDRDYRGKNLGLLIMQEIEKHVHTLPFTAMKLNAQSYAIPFYEKLGFVVTSVEFLDAGIPHRSMEKTI